MWQSHNSAVLCREVDVINNGCIIAKQNVEDIIESYKPHEGWWLAIAWADPKSTSVHIPTLAQREREVLRYPAVGMFAKPSS